MTDIKPLYYVCIPRRDGGYAIVGYGTDRAALSCHAQLAADTHGHAFICKYEEGFIDQATPKPRPEGEKPLVMPVITKQHKARTKDKKGRKSLKIPPRPSPIP